jgi:CMP-N-acetylneuraminic acid synthetase
MGNQFYKTVALVPLRGGSKSIPLKNIKDIAGKPLCAWVLEAASHAKNIDKVFVSTDSEAIRTVVDSLNLNIEIIQRPAAYSTDEASTESVMLHFMSEVNFEKVVTIQATSPLLKSTQLEQAVDLFEKEEYDSLLTAVRTKRFFWTLDNRPMNYLPQSRPRRQDFEGSFVENGAFYITTKNILEKDRCRLGGKMGIYEMPENSFVEIDEPEDWAHVSYLIKNSL